MDNEVNKTNNDVAPTVEPASVVAQPVKSAKKPKKSLVVGAIVAAAVVVLGGGSTLAYNMWYQNPDKILSDTVSNLFSRDSLAGNGVIKANTEESTTTVNIAHMIFEDQASLTVDANVDSKEEDLKIDIDGNAVYEKDGTFYIKVNNVQKLFDRLIESQMQSRSSDMTAEQQAMARGMVQMMFGSVIREIDGQWIKISPKDMTEDEDSSDSMKCSAEAFEMLSSDKAVQKELTDTYKKNRFMVVKENLGAKDGNLGFVYTFDQNKADDFEKAVEDTKFGQKAAECSSDDDADFDDTKDDELKADDVNVEIWVDRWSHDLVSAKVTSDLEDDGSLELTYTPDYDAEVKAIEIPKNATTLEELQKKLGGLLNF